jgi:hypothetical protein
MQGTFDRAFDGNTTSDRETLNNFPWQEAVINGASTRLKSNSSCPHKELFRWTVVRQPRSGNQHDVLHTTAAGMC